MLFENGPCLSDGPNATRFNPHAWTEYFNVVYLDQPAGVGLSYFDGRQAPTPSQAPLDSVAFIRMMYEAFPSLSKLDLHLSGESFAGRFVPRLASSIIDYNSFLTGDDAGFAIPLRSIFVGNPWIDPVVQLPSMHEVSCFDGWRGRYPQHLEQSACDAVLANLPHCEVQLRACKLAGPESPLCAMAAADCHQGYLAFFQNATRSLYDRRLRNCPGPGDCYPDIAECQSYLNSPAILETQLEVPLQTGGIVSKWNMMDMPTLERYVAAGDMYASTVSVLEKLLRAGLDVMLYVGVTDIICNPDGVLEAVRAVEWEGRPLFKGTPWEELPWTQASGGRAGRVKAMQNLWMVEVESAGHMVPYDQPQSSLKLLGYWLEHLEQRASSKNRATAGNFVSSEQKVLTPTDDRGVEL